MSDTVVSVASSIAVACTTILRRLISTSLHVNGIAALILTYEYTAAVFMCFGTARIHSDVGAGIQVAARAPEEFAMVIRASLARAAIIGAQEKKLRRVYAGMRNLASPPTVHIAHQLLAHQLLAHQLLAHQLLVNDLREGDGTQYFCALLL
ncbi:hypothetical protein FA95DRAFT_1613195 [Auriscalpium vulgare]|uniref:Uncharacterized protein n=1 Tax=Auriscalpium vulgare TaxID=40419 RepID=A0ACB8R3X2_9AGAM|nr:hypothetical protein FA95DRAFT_1613195 [Auriscalpium vulgare]